MKNKAQIITAAAVIICIVLSGVFLIASLDGANTDSDGYSHSQKSWPKNDLTEGFPEFGGDIYSVLINKTSTAVFVQNVEKDAADKYTSKLVSSGIAFKGDNYPKTAMKGDVFVTLAYNTDTKKFSITFALKEESEILSR